MFGTYSIKAIVDKLSEDNKTKIIENVCKSACIFDLKAGRDVIKSKKENSKSEGFPTIEEA